MDTLSKVSEYLNNLEAYLDEGDSLDAGKVSIEKSEEELEMYEALGHKSVLVKSGKHKEHETKEILDKLGFVRIDYADYGRKKVKEVHVEIHGFIFLVDFVVIRYANEGEPSVIFGRDFLVTTKSKVDFGLGEMSHPINFREVVPRKKLKNVIGCVLTSDLD
ncbi:hypothetical protein Tco_1347217 [Tanacetum coccineum]